MSQSVFKFEQYPDYSPENFLVSPSNREAFEAVRNFPADNYALSIYGPKGSGKTYLANILSRKNKTEIIEDINSKTDERELLHRLNTIKESGGYILLTSEKPPAEISFKLPDLVSRLAAINSVRIDAPDAELFRQLFARYFLARQLKISDEVISFLATRVERSFTAAWEIVEQIDKLSLEQKRNITIPLVKKILES